MQHICDYGNPNYWLSVATIDSKSNVKPLDIILKLEENNINRIELYDFNKVVQLCNEQMTEDKLQVNHSISKLAKIITNLIIYDFNKQK